MHLTDIKKLLDSTIVWNINGFNEIEGFILLEIKCPVSISATRYFLAQQGAIMGKVDTTNGSFEMGGHVWAYQGASKWMVK